jgi:hypothetical protein
VFRAKNDYVAINFEGRRRAHSERRAKTSPLKDVAGMLRSFSTQLRWGSSVTLIAERTNFETCSISFRERRLCLIPEPIVRQ